jgi:hypothetical protein
MITLHTKRDKQIDGHLKRAAIIEIEGRAFVWHSCRVLDIPTQTNIGNECMQRQQELFSEYEEKAKNDSEKRSELYAAFKRDQKTITRKKRQCQDLLDRFKIESNDLPPAQINRLKAFTRPKLAQLLQEIVELEAEQDEREAQIQVIEDRLTRLFSSYLIEKSRIQSLYDKFLVTFDGYARSAYSKVKLSGEPPYPDVVPTIAIMITENLISFIHTENNPPATFLPPSGHRPLSPPEPSSNLPLFRNPFHNGDDDDLPPLLFT